jgi:hypothetical protein
MEISEIKPKIERRRKEWGNLENHLKIFPLKQKFSAFLSPQGFIIKWKLGFNLLPHRVLQNIHLKLEIEDNEHGSSRLRFDENLGFEPRPFDT